MGAPWTALLSFSVTWIIYRVYLVFEKPVDELEEALGVDVAPIPEISLSSITKDAVLLYWKPSDTYHSPLKQDILVNGVKIEDLEFSDGSVQVTGLQPGHSYVIRAVATNHAGNSTYSRLIQVQTIPENGNVGVKRLADDHHMTRKTISGRRTSQPLPSHEVSAVSEIQGSDARESLAEWNRKLDTLRQIKEELELEIKRENDDVESERLELMQARDTLRKQLEEQEKEHQEKRRQVNELEKHLKAAQRRKQMKDQALRLKRSERQKMQEDIEKWETDQEEMQVKIGELTLQKLTVDATHRQKMQNLNAKYSETAAENKTLEEELKTLGTTVNELKTTAKFIQDEEHKQAERRELEHESRISQLDANVRQVYVEYYQFESEVARLQDLHARLVEDRQRDPDMYRVIPGVDYSRQGYNSNYSARSHAMGSGADSASNHFSSTSFGSGNRPLLGHMETSKEFNPTGGAMLSPGIGETLLPQSLLEGEEEMQPMTGQMRQQHIDTMNIRSNSWDQDPQSPHSLHSAPQSILNSPHESYVSIPNYYNMDPDRQSLQSTGSPYGRGLTTTTSAAEAGDLKSRFFAWPNKRGKVNELPALGSLKSGESQSFPLKEPESASRKRNTNMWTSPMSMFTRGTSDPAEDASALTALAKKKRSMVGPKLDPIGLDSMNRSSSPRPASVRSHDFLPRPSSESNPWGPDGLRQRISPLGGERNMSTLGPWSAAHSRRQSVQYGSTSNLSLGSLPNDFDGQLRSQPAPIGAERKNLKTKPKLNPAAPSFRVKVFGKNKPVKDGVEAELPEPAKTKSKSKTKSAKRKGKEIKHAPSVESDLNLPSEDGSLSLSHTSPRLSKDTHSCSQDDESQSSLLDSALPGSEGQFLSTPGSAITPSKESLIQKLQRKGSSKNFGSSLSWKDRSFFSKKGTGEPTTPGDVGEDPADDYVDRDLGAADTSTAPSTPVLDIDKEKPSRLSSSFGRLMGKGKSRADKEEKERESLELDFSHDE